MQRVSENSELPLVVWGAYSHEGKSGGYFMEAKKVVLYFNVIFCKIITRKVVEQNWSFFKKIMRGI